MQVNVDIPNGRLLRYFLSGDKERIGDVTIQIRPLPSDIPVFDQHYYDSIKDNLVILFKCDFEPREHRLSESITLFLEPKEMRIAGVKISGVRQSGINHVTVSIRKTLEDFADGLRDQVAKATAWDEKLKKVGFFDRERRKLNFFINEIPKTLTQLSELRA